MMKRSDEWIIGRKFCKKGLLFRGSFHHRTARRHFSSAQGLEIESAVRVVLQDVTGILYTAKKPWPLAFTLAW